MYKPADFSQILQLTSAHDDTNEIPILGSVLGPLLFLIFIHDMPPCIDHCNWRLFADDSLIYHEISCQASIVELQSDLDRLAEWARTWKQGVIEGGGCALIPFVYNTMAHNSCYHRLAYRN